MYRAAAQRSCEVRSYRPGGLKPTKNTPIGGPGAGTGARAEVRLGGGSRRWLYWAAAAIASVFPRAWGAERERPASTHAMRMQTGKTRM
eukprot:2391020-Pleurochrysis_carterae.AAC.1